MIGTNLVCHYFKMRNPVTVVFNSKNARFGCIPHFVFNPVTA